MHYRDTHLPQGAIRERDDSVVWRIWAPVCDAVVLVTFSSGEREEAAMTPEDDGYFVHRRAHVEEGLPYLYRLGDGREFPDPASRFQPQGVHKPSAVFFPEDYHWTDEVWRGVAREDLVLYELHVGAFTPEGTFDAAAARLPDLASLGVTAIEVMPVAQFAGARNWGYDGVFHYAVQNSYGGPRALQRFVDAAHRAGLAVILDAVYNHFGNEGNYCGNFGPYFTDRYHSPWGLAINYDGPESDAVRKFAIDNARMWVRDFHLDGLRLDAVQTIYDLGPWHIAAEIASAVQDEAVRMQRVTHVIAESDQNDVRWVRPPEAGGYGLDAVWADDFHHAMHTLLTGERDGYYSDFGPAALVAKAFNDAFVYDGCYSPYRRRRHGSPVGATDRTRFIVCIQNHDQVGNRALGDRLGTIIAPCSQRLACGLLLLSPCVPLLFMGEEYGEVRPFPFFCSFEDPVIIQAVQSGRRREFAGLEFAWNMEIPDPQAPETFGAAKLAWSWPEGSPHAQLRRLYQDMLFARRNWSALRDRRQTTARLTRDADSENEQEEPPLLLIERGGEAGILAVANLTKMTRTMTSIDLRGREQLLSTEDARYGGSRSKDHEIGRILAHEILIFTSTGTHP